MEKSVIIEALRCTTKVGVKCRTDCPYRMREQINPEIGIPAEEVIDGVGYWISCDCDMIALDAADALEASNV